MASEEMTFGLVLKNAIKKAGIKNKTLAKNINEYNGGISPRQVQRWLADENVPQNRDWIVDMINPLCLKKQGKDGVKTCNALLQKAGHEELTEKELQDYFGIQTNDNFTKFPNIKLHLFDFIKKLIPLLSQEEFQEILEIRLAGGQINMEKIEERLRSEGLTITHQGKEEK